MKVSDITNELLADYLKLTYADLTTAEKTNLTALIGIAKAFIRSETSIDERTVKGEEVGIGDGETSAFNLVFPAVPASEKVYVDGALQTDVTHYVLDDTTGRVQFVTAPADSTKVTADYTTGLDAYEEFWIVVYVLCQDMYDNRALYVDKTSINHVVESILGHHSRNLICAR